MNVNKNKIIKASAVFLGVMLIFTIISTKVDYLMTAEVQAVSSQKGVLSFQINAYGVAAGGAVTFELSLEKESYITKGDNVTLTFENVKGGVTAVVEGKNFNPDTQTITLTCKIINADKYDIYDYQYCKVSFDYIIGNYDIVLPRACVIQSGASAYVFVIETQSGVMGAYEIVRKVDVSVLEMDEFNAAVEAPLNTQSRIVQNSTKPLRHEQKVRTN